MAEHHRICLLRSFLAKRSITSSPAEQSRKGLVNNIKPYAVYLFIHFFYLFFYEHTHGDVLSTGPIVSVPDGEELKVRVRAICSRFQRPLMSCDWLYHQCRWASNRYWRKARRKVSTSTWLSLFAQLLTTLTSKLTQQLLFSCLGHYVTLGYKSENKNITQLWRLQQCCMCILSFS